IWGNPFYHQYLCVPDGKGDYTCGGQDQRGESKVDGLWGPGKASNDTKEAAGRCDLVETDNSGRYFSTAPNRGERKGSYPFNSPCPNGTEKV
ncbi:hypothetical protein ACQ7B1_06050, partial [Escherichia coli]